MAQLIAGFTMPHAPGTAVAPGAPSQAQQDNCFGAYRTIQQRVQALGVDTVIIIGDDHYTLNGPACIPSCMIGIGELEGPAEPWLGLARARVPNNTALAHHIMRFGLDNGVDWAASKTLTLDHSTFLPYHFAARLPGLRVIPVYLNSGIEPLIGSRRSYQVGQSIGAAIAAAPSGERVAIYGTGGISHWVGMARMGEVNRDFDMKVIGMVTEGDIEGLVALSDERIVDEAGNGALEIKNWLCAMGAMSTVGACTGQTIAYEPVVEWVTGCAYMELKAA